MPVCISWFYWNSEFSIPPAIPILGEFVTGPVYLRFRIESTTEPRLASHHTKHSRHHTRGWANVHILGRNEISQSQGKLGIMKRWAMNFQHIIYRGGTAYRHCWIRPNVTLACSIHPFQSGIQEQVFVQVPFCTYIRTCSLIAGSFLSVEIPWALIENVFRCMPAPIKNRNVSFAFVSVFWAFNGKAISTGNVKNQSTFMSLIFVLLLVSHNCVKLLPLIFRPPQLHVEVYFNHLYIGLLIGFGLFFPNFHVIFIELTGPNRVVNEHIEIGCWRNACFLALKGIEIFIQLLKTERIRLFIASVFIQVGDKLKQSGVAWCIRLTIFNVFSVSVENRGIGDALSF